MRWMERRARWMRDVSRSLLLSISPMRFLISLHFWRYDSSTDAGSAGVGPDGDLAVCGWGLAGGRGQRRVVRGGARTFKLLWHFGAGAAQESCRWGVNVEICDVREALRGSLSVML